MLTLGVIFGGRSVEHEVSVISAVQAIKSLREFKYEVVPIYITKQGEWYTGPGMTNIANYRDIKKLLSWGEKVHMSTNYGDFNLYRDKAGVFKSRIVAKLDVIFPILHGGTGEDGSIQGLFELIGIPYVGSDTLASAIAMDKVSAKLILRAAGIPVVNFVWFTEKDWHSQKALLQPKIEELGYPLIVKPANLGSSVGITVVKSSENLEMAIDMAGRFAEKILVEKMVSDLVEINCSVTGHYHDCAPSVCEQPVKSGDILSYKDKYMSGGKGGKNSGKSSGMASVQRIIPANISDNLNKQVQDMAVETFKTVGLAGVVRIDFLFDNSSKTLFVNEINTIPGSLSFYLWEYTGKKYVDLLDELIANAVKLRNNKNNFMVNYNQNIFAMGGGAGLKMGGPKIRK